MLGNKPLLLQLALQQPRVFLGTSKFPCLVAHLAMDLIQQVALGVIDDIRSKIRLWCDGVPRRHGDHVGLSAGPSRCAARSLRRRLTAELKQLPSLLLAPQGKLLDIAA